MKEKVVRTAGMVEKLSIVVQIGRIRTMKRFVCVFTLLVVVWGLPKPVLADTTEYKVVINAGWEEIDFATVCIPNCSEEVGSFTSTFDVDASGNLIPSSMTFSVSGIPDSSPPLVFDSTPPTYTYNGGAVFTSTTPFNWSDSVLNLITFTPSTWPPTGSETFTAASTIDLNCYSSDCDLLHCADLSCATGGDNPANLGSVVVTQFTATPEPPASLLMLTGILFLVAFHIGRAANARQKAQVNLSDLARSCTS